MAGTDKHDGVDANVVGVDPSVPPVESVIVADKRNNFGRRLAVFALVLLTLFFVIGSYIQSARNADLLRRASVDRSKLITGAAELTESVNQQIRFNKRLQLALKKQNQLLGQAGFETVQVPSAPTAHHQTQSRPHGDHSAHPSSSSPRPKPSSHPSPIPSSTPTPTPGPVRRITRRVCRLTGICLTFPLFNIF